MEDNIAIESTYMEMLERIMNESPHSVIVSSDLFEQVDEEILIYVLGHFYISVKNSLKPFCPFYLDTSLEEESYIMLESNKKLDEMLLYLNYKIKEVE